MSEIPLDAEDKIGSPQVLARFIQMDGKQYLVRLQKPFEEPDYDQETKVIVRIRNGRATQIKDESYIKYGASLIVETWSDATRSVVTAGLTRPDNKTEEQFTFGIRYMMNHCSDDEIVEILKTKGIDTQLRFQVNAVEKVELPKPPKQLKKPQ